MKSAEQVFIEYLKENKLPLTPQRRCIAEIFLQTEGHFSAERLCELVRLILPNLGQATIYRTLKLLVDSGLAEAIDPGDGVVLYEHGYGHEHHDHLVCRKCGRKVEVQDPVIEKRQEALASMHGFNLIRHRMYLYGECRDCRETE
nr:Fur family transcriptional regulator [Desulfovibrio sp. Huiquan2017]